MRGARPSSAFQLVLVADCEETECHGRGMSMRVSMGSFKAYVRHFQDPVCLDLPGIKEHFCLI